MTCKPNGFAAVLIDLCLQGACANEAAMGKNFKHMTDAEIRLAQNWRAEGMPLSECGRLMGRSPETIRLNTTPALLRKRAGKIKGRPGLINAKKLDRIMVRPLGLWHASAQRSLWQWQRKWSRWQIAAGK